MYNKKSSFFPTALLLVSLLGVSVANAQSSSCPYSIASPLGTSKTKTVNLDRVHRRRGSGDHGECLERSVLHAGRTEQERTR